MFELEDVIILLVKSSLLLWHHRCHHAVNCRDNGYLVKGGDNDRTAL